MKKAAIIMALLVYVAGGLYWIVQITQRIILTYEQNIAPITERAEPFDHQDTILMVGDTRTPDSMRPILKNERILLPFEAVKTHIDPNILYDAAEQSVTVTTEDRVIRMHTYRLQAYINHEPVPLRLPVSIHEGRVYLPIEFLSDFYSIDVRHVDETDVVIVDHLVRTVHQARVIAESAYVRSGRSERSYVYENLSFGDTVRVFSAYEGWLKVRMDNGVVGFMRTSDVEQKWITQKEVPYRPEVDLSWQPKEGKIHLIWHGIYHQTPDMSARDRLVGVDVLSPRWFELADDLGSLKNLADAAYMDWAHSNGHHVWAMVVNDFGDPNMTSRFLHSTQARERFIRQLMAYAALYGFDGVNIDFENVFLRDRDMLTQLMREMTPLLREQGLVVSISVGVPDGSDTYSLCYDHEALGEIVDYVTLMTYDQHWHNAPTAGSVAQYSWVEDRVVRTLEMVPAHKLLVGIPLYARVWEVRTDAQGNQSIRTAITPTMNGMRNILRQRENYTIEWDETSGQFYVEYEENDALYKMWMEDGLSIDLKTSLALKYDLAGVCSWELNTSTPFIFEVIERNMKKTDTYEQWQERHENTVFEFAFEDEIYDNDDREGSQ